MDSSGEGFVSEADFRGIFVRMKEGGLNVPQEDLDKFIASLWRGSGDKRNELSY